MERVLEAGAAMSATFEATRHLAGGLKRLAGFYENAGAELAKIFPDFALSKDLGEDAKQVTELFVAWREVGEAEVNFASRARELALCLEKQAKQAEDERSQRTHEAERLIGAVEGAAAAAASKRNGGGGGLLGWLGGRAAEAEPIDEEAEQRRLNSQRTATDACMIHLADQMAASHQRNRALLTDNLTEVRRMSKAVGEKVSSLRPSWRGVNTTGPAGTSRRVRGDSGGGVASSSAGPGAGKISGLIKSLATSEGRQRHQEKADAEAEASRSPAANESESAPLTAPPVEVLSDGSWAIRGVYEHQVLKAGLRQLDDQWVADRHALDVFPRNASGSALLLRESLMRNLLCGKIRLQSVPVNDVAAAQNDIKKLSLVQLLRLRILHLDFTPSGCGADTINSVGATHEAFLGALDNMLFRELGCKAVAGANCCDSTVAKSACASDGVSAKSSRLSPTEDAHRLGREAVFLVAAAAAVPSPNCWSWWLPDGRRVFFDTSAFDSSLVFPLSVNGVAGVLEVTDLSKPDKHDPSGRLRWMDWRVEHIVDEASLSVQPKRSLVGSDPLCASDESGVATSGGATAAMVSPDLLRGLRSGLRKTALSSGAEVACGEEESTGTAEANTFTSEMFRHEASTPQAKERSPHSGSAVRTLDFSPLPKTKPSEASAPTGPSGMSPELLSGMRTSLRKTGSLPTTDAAEGPRDA